MKKVILLLAVTMAFAHQAGATCSARAGGKLVNADHSNLLPGGSTTAKSAAKDLNASKVKGTDNK